MRAPEKISDITSPNDLPQNGEYGVEDEILPTPEALPDLDLVAFDLDAPGKAEMQHDRVAVRLHFRP